MNRGQDAPQPEAVAHRQREFRQHLARLRAHDGHPEQTIAPRLGQHLDVADDVALDQGTVKIFQRKAGHLMRDAPGQRLAPVQADTRDLRIQPGHRRHHTAVDRKAAQMTEQRVDRRAPGLVARGMGELPRTGDIAAGQDVRMQRFQVLVGLDDPAVRDAQRLQPEPVEPRAAPDRDQQVVEGQRVASGQLQHAAGPARHVRHDTQHLGAQPQRHPRAGQRLRRDRRDLVILAGEQALALLDQRDAAAQPRQRLRQLAADRPATEHRQPLRRLAQPRPQGVAGQEGQIGQAGQRRHGRRRTAGDDDGAGAQHLGRTVGGRDLDMPGIEQPGTAGAHLHAQRGVALDRVVRGHRGHRLRHPRHHRAEIRAHRRGHQPELGRATDLMRQSRSPDQRLARHAAGVQAVAAHVVRLDQRHLGAHRRGDVAADQPGSAGTDHDQVAVMAAWTACTPRCLQPRHLQPRQRCPCDPRKQRQQHEGPQQRGRDDARQRLQPCQLGAGVHIDQRARQHADLADDRIAPGGHAGEPHQQVDDEERHQRHQPQREQVKGAVALDAALQLLQPRAEARGHPVAQQMARDQHRQRRPGGRGEGHDQQAPAQPEQRAAGQRQHHRARQGQRRHRDVEHRIADSDSQRLRLAQRQQGFALRLQRLQPQPATQIESPGQRQKHQQQQDQPSAAARTVAKLHHGAPEDGRAQPAARRVTIVIRQSPAKPQASTAKADGHRHIAAKQASVSVPSVSPPR